MDVEDDSTSSEPRFPQAKSNPFSNGSDWVNLLPNPIIPSEMLPLRDVSFDAVWTLSSCKTDGFGIYELMDESVDKYWQSDGPQPHTVTIEFKRKTDLTTLWLYLDYKNDESYTPSKVVVYVGSSLMHIDEGRETEFHEPVGWQSIDLRDDQGRPVRAMCLQIQVVANHQNGRDSHIRHIRVAGPRISRFDPSHRLQSGNPSMSTDPSVSQFSKLSRKFMSSMNIR